MEPHEIPPAPKVAAPYIDDLIRALEKASRQEEQEGMTMRELVACIKMSPKKIRVRLRGLKEEGRLESVDVSRENIAGKMSTVPAYRLKDGTS